jgi:hypothetical protein
MAQASDFAARGKVTAVIDGKIVFAPSNTNYAIQLTPVRPYDGPIGQLISANIRVKARKVYTVPSGGGFISPLFGPPRTIQGRAVHVENGMVVIRAGLPVMVELPTANDSVDLEEGPIAVGSLVNAVALPGASFEILDLVVQ